MDDIEDIVDNINEKLERFKIYRDSGALTQEEYNKRVEEVCKETREAKETLKKTKIIFDIEDIIGNIIGKLERFEIYRDNGTWTQEKYNKRVDEFCEEIREAKETRRKKELKELKEFKKKLIWRFIIFALFCMGWSFLEK